ncbi:MAG: BatA domain-containing protein [Ignavibacteriales bacterium]|nr:BatA domain-containing protein [Ignavibacteriales bacterium]
MTFLNPLVLLGLFAAAIPLLLHLLSLRKLRTIEFSTLRFIKELQRTRIRRLKLRQILLLILRTLLVILIVLAFSRPTLRGSLPPAVSTLAKSSAVVLLDDSYSMTASDEHGEYLKQAREAAAHILGLFYQGDDVSVVPLSEAVSQSAETTSAPPHHLATAASIIEGIKPSPVHRKLEDGLRVAARLLSSARNLNKEVYVISDFQAGLMVRTRAGAEALFDPGVRFFSVPIGRRELRNASVESVDIPGALLETGKPFLLKSVVRNHSTGTIRNHLTSVFLNGTRVAQRGVTVDAGATAEIEFSIVPKTGGHLRGFVELEDDDVQYDNRRYFSLHLPERLRVLLVGDHKDLRYIATALATRQENGSVLRTQQTSYERLTSSLLAGFDVVLLANLRELTAVQAEGLRRFVFEGGGLILFPGRTTTPEAFAPLRETLQLPELAAIETLRDGQGSSSFLEFDRAELRHPLFQEMFQEDDAALRNQPAKSLESPRIQTHARLIPTERAFSLITIAGGSPFLLEQQLGAGRILLFAVSADLSFSDFPLKGLFVPLLHRSVAYTAQEQIKQASAVSGDEVILTGLPALARATIVTPRRFELPVVLQRRSLRFTESREPGIYEVKTGETVLRTFSVNMHPDESAVLKADEQKVISAFERLGVKAGAIRTIDDLSSIRPVILETRHGVELWKQLLLAALIIALLEAVVARESRHALAQFTAEPA